MVLTHLEPPRLDELRSDFFDLAGPRLSNLEGTDQRRRGDGDLASARAGVRTRRMTWNASAHANLRHIRRRRAVRRCNVAPNSTRSARAHSPESNSKLVSEVVDTADISPLLLFANTPA